VCIGLRGLGWIEIGPEICSSTDSELEDLLEIDSFVVFAV
jgi:hypothetical protein